MIDFESGMKSKRFVHSVRQVTKRTHWRPVKKLLKNDCRSNGDSRI